jgi:hypothetical protein
MATEYCAWPDGCSKYFPYPDGNEVARLDKADELQWSRYNNPGLGLVNRWICDRHTALRNAHIWKEIGPQREEPKS